MLNVSEESDISTRFSKSLERQRHFDGRLPNRQVSKAEKIQDKIKASVKSPGAFILGGIIAFTLGVVVQKHFVRT